MTEHWEPTAANNGRRVLSSVLKALELLSEVARRPAPVGVSELARDLDLPRSSVHLMLSTLQEAGWLDRLDGGRYRLSMAIVRLGQAALEQADLGRRALPTMEALAAATGEAVSLSVLDGGEALIVQRVESGHVLRTDLRVGTRMSLASSASGRILVAFASAAQLAALDRLQVPRLSQTLLDDILREGVAVSVDEFFAGISAVAAPVRDPSGHVVAALSLAWPTGRLNPSASVDLVRRAAHEMSRHA